MKAALYKAIKSHYVAEQSAAKATLKVYFNSPAGIGEHPQVVEEMIKQVNKLSQKKNTIQHTSIT